MDWKGPENGREALWRSHHVAACYRVRTRAVWQWQALSSRWMSLMECKASSRQLKLLWCVWRTCQLQFTWGLAIALLRPTEEQKVALSIFMSELPLGLGSPGWEGRGRASGSREPSWILEFILKFRTFMLVTVLDPSVDFLYCPINWQRARSSKSRFPMSIRKAVKPHCPYGKQEESCNGDWEGPSSLDILTLKWETAVWPEPDWGTQSSLTIDYDSCGCAFPLGDNVFGNTSIVGSIWEAGLLDDEVVINSNIKIPIFNRIDDVFIFQPFHLKMHKRNR